MASIPMAIVKVPPTTSPIAWSHQVDWRTCFFLGVLSWYRLVKSALQRTQKVADGTFSQLQPGQYINDFELGRSEKTTSVVRIAKNFRLQPC
jgi:hypothetical protein